jgi:Mg/Co/Ni transporter MgtE
MNAVNRLSNAAKLNATGLVLTAAGMVLQIAGGSKLYPSFAGPIVLLVAAVIVAFGPKRWAPYVGLLVPLVLGLGAIIAAVMSGEFINQLTDIGRPGVFLGSVMHVVGLIAAVAGGIGMLRGRPGASGRDD